MYLLTIHSPLSLFLLALLLNTPPASSSPDTSEASSSSPCSLSKINLTSSPVSAGSCQCASSAALTATVSLSDREWAIRWSSREQTAPAGSLLVTVDLEDSTRGHTMLLQVQMRHALRVVAMKEFLIAPGMLSHFPGCFSFSYDDAPPGSYSLLLVLHKVDPSLQLTVVASEDHYVLVEDLSGPRAAVEQAVMDGRDMTVNVRLTGVARRQLLLLVVAIEVSSLWHHQQIMVVDAEEEERVEPVRVSGIAGSDFLLSIVLSERLNQSSILPIMNVSRSLSLAACNPSCLLNDGNSTPAPVSMLRLSARGSGKTAQPANEELVVAGAEHSTAKIDLVTVPELPVAGLQVQVSAAALGLRGGQRYRLSLSAVMVATGRVVFQVSSFIKQSAAPAALEHLVPSCGLGEVEIRAVLHAVRTEEQGGGEQKILQVARRFVAMGACQVNYLWSSSGQPIFDGPLEYRASPFHHPVNLTQQHLGKAGALDVTLTTTATLDRLVTLISTAAHWGDNMAVAMYARSAVEQGEIRRFVMEILGPWFATRGKTLEVVLLSACPDPLNTGNDLVFPINMLRKICCAIAKTELILFTDVDMQPSDGLAASIQLAYSRGQLGPMDLLVLPAFRSNELWPLDVEVDVNEGNLSVNTFSILFRDLRQHFATCSVYVPGIDCRGTTSWSGAGVFHMPTDYDRWLDAEDLYEASYLLGYEPYVVLNRSSWLGRHGAGVYDDRYVFWGWDKASMTAEAAYLGYSFMVLPKGFFVHASDALFNVEHVIAAQLDISLPEKSGTGSGWGPPDTVGRRLLQDTMLYEYTRPQEKAAHRSCVLKAFEDKACQPESIRMEVSTKLEVVRAGYQLGVQLHNLARASSFQLTAFVKGKAEGSDNPAFYRIVPADLTGDVHEVKLLLGKLESGRHEVDVELFDLHAAKLMPVEIARLAYQEVMLFV
ncbi:hypothetical protein GUITHDRAFT_149039 [Guillardia theta CCMP2712]|uniref:Uncharacterized protein n=1 Tax=Guillardia theta (strain CCMP2712) TaxID=905079 RepID=L1I705_GUITC|nr:hypothetical protein GUITHDRAFT_149039 [Guillardia theta CCMP2712]EKX31837.1 hypothetical protein GUITHDRAFT_149039 [Guillardia theta CCMP2712]|eukprot:XP_005818817.1 hypothetical protein GUITHDRAFT_149039 [Guillardia theta CCMP2712]